MKRHEPEPELELVEIAPMVNKLQELAAKVFLLEKRISVIIKNRNRKS